MLSEVKTNSASAPKPQAPVPVVLSSEQPPAKTVIQVDVQTLHKQLSETVQKVNQVLMDGGRNLSLSIDNNLGGPIVIVRKADSGEVVRQIPSEAVLAVARNIDALKGIIFNENI